MELIEFANSDGDTLRGIYSEGSSSRAVLFVHGFEKSGLEMKFKNIVNELNGDVHTFRFDFSGCGISDGSFDMMTTNQLISELAAAISTLKARGRAIAEISLVGHSFGACVALQYAIEHSGEIQQLVFLAPAFNQRIIQRFFFGIARQKGRPEKTIVTLENLKEVVDEDEFQRSLSSATRMTKAHHLRSEYYKENAERDFQDLLSDPALDVIDMILVHGDSDRAVPLGSNDRLPGDLPIITVRSGDHDLERPDMVDQYVDTISEFLRR